MIEDFGEVKTRDEIEKIKDEDKKSEEKGKFTAFESLKTQLKQNEEALEIHKNNILFIKK